MEEKILEKCLEDFLIETILNCPDSCIIEEESKLTISIPEDNLMEALTENLRKKLYNILENECFINDLSKIISEKRNKKLKGKLIKDISGFVIYFE